MAETVADLGFDTDVPLRVEETSGLDATDIEAKDWFLWSRIDGRSSLEELFRLSGQSRDATIETLRRLHDRGLIDLPNRERPKPVNKTRPASLLAVPNWSIPFDDFEVQYSESCQIPEHICKLVWYYHFHLRIVTYYQLMGVERDASTTDIRTAYYRLTKIFHPDRWFRKELGAVEEVIREVFAWINRGYQTLSNDARRREYDATVDRGLVGPWQQAEAEAKESGPRAGVSGGHGLGRNALVARGRRFRADGNYRQAADCFQRAILLGPEVNLALELAESLLEGGIDLDEALDAVRGVQAESPQNYAAMLLEARILKAMGRREAAKRICKRILALHPNHLAAKAELAALESE